MLELEQVSAARTRRPAYDSSSRSSFASKRAAARPQTTQVPRAGAAGKVIVVGAGEQPGIDVGALGSHGWVVTSANQPENASQLMKAQGFTAGIAVCSSLPPRSDARWIIDLVRTNQHIPWVLVTQGGFLGSAEARAVVLENFADYRETPGDAGAIAASLEHARRITRLRVGDDRGDVSATPFEHGIVARDAAMQAVLDQLDKVAASSDTVLITGESGTGKELLAQAVHGLSPRRGGPFIAINCAAIPASLFQSELFGHEAGAYTGATSRRTGLIEAASGGTLLLDEIGELTPELQVSLLRFLETQTVQRIGSHREIQVDVRVIACTNVEIEEAVEAGTIRKDLFYRLNVLRLRAPPLRERGADVELLAEHLLEQNVRSLGLGPKVFSSRALAAIRRYSWPGNIRQLTNAVRGAAVRSKGRIIEVPHLDLGHAQSKRDAPLTLEEVRERATKLAVTEALERNNHNVTQAAKDLGVSRKTVYRLM